MKSPLPKLYHAPHSFTRWTTPRIMWSVNAALLPAAAWGIWLFGWPGFRTLFSAIAGAAAAEFLCQTAARRRGLSGSLKDGSAVLTGLLLGLTLSPLVPWYQPVAGSFFAIWVCKWSFGGLGGNWVNPALAARIFIFLSFNQNAVSWPTGPFPEQSSQTIEAQSSATPLQSFQRLRLKPPPETDSPGALLRWLGETGLSPAEGLKRLFLGLHSGAAGEGSSLLLLLGGLLLLGLGIISWHIPLSCLGSFALLTWIFGGLPLGRGYWEGEVLFQLLSGGLMLGAWFMATDPVSSPSSSAGKLLFGTGCGGLTFLFRFYGSHPEGVMFAIVLMNICAPALETLTSPSGPKIGKKSSKLPKGPTSRLKGY